MGTMDRVFNAMYKVMPMREVLFREATGYDETAGSITYAPERGIKAKILDKPRQWDEARSAWVVIDGCFLTIWYRDWFGRSDDTATEEERLAMVSALKGNVKEVDATNYSRFVVDGVPMQYQSHALLARPDGVLYAVRLTLQAA